MGSVETYQWMNENPAVEMRRQAWTNNPSIIGQNHKMVAINQALEVDLTGQVASESIGPRMYSGTGGQMDFTLGSQLSPGESLYMPSINSRYKEWPSFENCSVVKARLSDYYSPSGS